MCSLLLNCAILGSFLSWHWVFVFVSIIALGNIVKKLISTMFPTFQTIPQKLTNYLISSPQLRKCVFFRKSCCFCESSWWRLCPTQRHILNVLTTLATDTSNLSICILISGWNFDEGIWWERLFLYEFPPASSLSQEGISSKRTKMFL